MCVGFGYMDIDLLCVSGIGMQGRIQDFKLRGGTHLKKLRRAEGGAKIFGVFRVKNHDFTPKNHIFSIAEGGAKMFEVFRVKNHDFTPKNHIFSNFRECMNVGLVCVWDELYWPIFRVYVCWIWVYMDRGIACVIGIYWP